MVAVAECDHILVARVFAGRKDRDFVGLAAAVGEVRPRQPRRHFLGQLFGKLHDGRVQIDRRRVLQQAGLLADSFDDLRMAMANADRDDAGKRIQIPLALLVPHVLHLAFDDHQRIAVVRDDARRQVLVPQGEHFVSRRPVVRGRLVIANGK